MQCLLASVSYSCQHLQWLLALWPCATACPGGLPYSVFVLHTSETSTFPAALAEPVLLAELQGQEG